MRILSTSKPAAGMRSSLCDELGFANRIYYLPELKTNKLAKLLRMVQLKFPKNLSSGFSSYLMAEVGAAAQFENWKPDIVHCHFGPVGNLGAALKKNKYIDSALTTTFHGFDVSKTLKEKSTNFYDDLFVTGDHFFSINEYYLKIIQGLGAPANKTSLFHMGVDCDALEYKPRQFPSSGAIECISVGRMTEKKGFAYTIEAFAKALRARPDMDLRLNIVGDGPLLSEIKEIAKVQGVQDRVVFHGSLQHSQVKDLLSDMHIFMLPSVTSQDGDMEGIPVALMEAMATGIPVLSTYHSGIPEMITDNVSGFLSPERDTDHLSNKLLHLIDNPQIWTSIIAAARGKIEREFNRAKQSEILFQTFRNLAGKR